MYIKKIKERKIKLKQEMVRNRLLQYVTDKGVNYSFICKQIELPNSVMTLFKSGRKDLWQEHLNKLDEFLSREKY